MKKLVYILALCFISHIGLCQNEYDHDPSMEGQDHSHQQDSVEKSNVKHFRKSWKWEHEGVYKKEVALDTLMDGIQNYNYIFKKSIANTYLGGFPSPYVSDIFIRRDAVEDFYPLTDIRAYLFKPTDALNYNNTTPFTQLIYFNGGSRGKAETLLDVLHMQNIRPFWNAGFRYNLMSNDGRYMNQKSKAYNFSFFSTYERNRLAISLFVNQNNGFFTENGGVTDRSYVRDSSEKAENIRVNLSPGTTNNYRNFNFYTHIQYNIGKKKETVHATDTSYTYPAKAIVAFTAEDNEHQFKEQTANILFFPNTYIDSTQSYDPTTNHVYRISTKLVVNEHPKYKYLPGIYAGLDFKYLDYRQRVTYDTASNIQTFGTDKFTGTYLTAGIFNVDTSALLNFDVHGSLCIVGDYIGNFLLKGFIQQAFNKAKSRYIQADAKIELKEVNPFLNFYFGNHDRWDNNFNAIKTLNIEGKYVDMKTRSEIGVAISNTFSYIYFDTTSMPVQTSKPLMVFTIWGRQIFKAGHFYFDQTIYCQQSNHDNILALPLISLYSHNYYQNMLFKNALGFQAGFDIFYNTSFFANNYMPSIQQFYNQKEGKTGNYPKLDVFINLHIKRADIFVKYEHLNYYFSDGNYFSAYDYPINPAMLKFGVRWNFLD